MIIGIGVDIIKIERIKEAIERSGHHFLNKVFTKAEIESSSTEGDKNAFFAMRFAAKESILKALGTGWIGIDGTQLEILRGEYGKPVVKFWSDLSEIMARRGVQDVFLSMSFDSEYAIAVAVLVGKSNQISAQ